MIVSILDLFDILVVLYDVWFERGVDSDRKKQAQQLRARGREQIKQKLYREADAQFGAALRLDPDCIGLALMKKREWPAALNELRQAHELTSANSNIRLVYEAVLYASNSR